MSLAAVAKRSGVSTATVSRVFSGSVGVRESTRLRVIAAAEALNYSPNLHASALASGRSRLLGVVVSNVENPFFLDIFRSMEEEASEAGYTLVMEHTGYQAERLESSLRSLQGLHLAGIAVITSEVHESLLEELSRRNLPVVIYDAEHPAPHVATIRVRYDIGMRRAVEYLRSLGHQRMAFVGHHARLGPLRERMQTFIDTMRLCAPHAEFVTAEHEDTLHGGRQAATNLLNSDFAPTAILCANDFMALGVLRALRERGLRVPEDVSVTGFDNITLSEFAVPPLTTLDVPRWRIGRLCFEALVNHRGAARIPTDTVIEPELVLRGSTGLAPATNRKHAKRRQASQSPSSTA